MLRVSNLTVRYADTPILKNISFSIHNREVTAVIGENGAGKTTLLNALLGQVELETGIIECNTDVGYVPQHPYFGKTIRDSFPDTYEWWRIERALEQVDLYKPADFQTDKLSGGQKTKLSIATVLAPEHFHGLLLLDEPTNNLDRQSLMWLQNYITSYNGAIIIVSHDRDFINATCTRILEIHDGTIQSYSGNYELYKEVKALEEKLAHDTYKKFIGEKKRIEKIVHKKSEQMRSVTNESYDKIKHESRMGYRGNKNAAQKRTGRLIRALNSRLEHLGDIEKPRQSSRYSSELLGSVHEAKLLLRIDRPKITFSPQLVNVSLEIRGSQRVRIHGVNGSGKSTLLKIAAGRLQIEHGSVTVGTNVTFGYLSQDVDGLNHAQSAIQNLRNVCNDVMKIYREARALGLASHDLTKPVFELSRGQQAKVSFTKLLLGQFDLLVLDEPTNHLDIPTRETIEAALNTYSGAILVASHDEYFVRKMRISKTVLLDKLV